MEDNPHAKQVFIKPIISLKKCKRCAICVDFCPDSCISISENRKNITIDYQECKGCRICSAVCPYGAIEYVLEEIE